MPSETGELLLASAELAGVLHENPEMLPLWESLPALAYEASAAREERAATFSQAFERMFATDGAMPRAQDFDRTFELFLAGVGAGFSDADQRRRVRSAAAYTWNLRADRLWETKQQEEELRRERFAGFQAIAPHTWAHSGRVHYSRGLQPGLFTAAQAGVLRTLAASTQGVREKRVAINTGLHAHIDSGSGGIAFFYTLADDGQVDLVVYAVSHARRGNDYMWDGSGSGYIKGTPDLPRDERLVRSEELVGETGGAGARSATEAAKPNHRVEDKASYPEAERAVTLGRSLKAFHDALAALRAAITDPRAAHAWAESFKGLADAGIDTVAVAVHSATGRAAEEADRVLAETAARGSAAGGDAPETRRAAVLHALAVAGPEAARTVAEVLYRPPASVGTDGRNRGQEKTRGKGKGKGGGRLRGGAADAGVPESQASTARSVTGEEGAGPDVASVPHDGLLAELGLGGDVVPADVREALRRLQEEGGLDSSPVIGERDGDRPDERLAAVRDLAAAVAGERGSS
ncbi:hypothetical protein, partial [Streptomyces sp. NPDC086010]|uniref:hypothetical protein n=1 Tax=Streptomyces sp. NPDC086010 TaxID=3365745 RepID=UPI0037CFE346